MGLSFGSQNCYATPGALLAVEQSGDSLAGLFLRHHRGDWGDVDAHDRQLNDESVITGGRLMSVYHLTDGTTVWIITDGTDDENVRQASTLLLPAEY